MKTSLSFLGVAVVLCLALTLVNIWLIDKSIADLQFRQAADPIAQELIAKVEGPDGWARVADFCGDFNEVDHVIVRPGGYVHCFSSGNLPSNEWMIRATIWASDSSRFSGNPLGTVEITLGPNGKVREIRHKRGST